MEIHPSNHVGLSSTHTDNSQKKISLPTSNVLDNAAQLINLDESIINSAEELADVISTFGRASKTGRKNDAFYNDSALEIFEDNVDEKLYAIMTQVGKIQSGTSFLNFSRHLFSNDWDLIQVLRELLLNKKMSERQKKKIKDALKDIVKFGDRKKLHSSANIGVIAKRFSQCINGDSPSPEDLRNSYLSFLELELPATFIYQGWIDEFGYHNRKLMLSFMLAALVADIKSSEPGIHSHEFGPLSTRLSNARTLHTLDNDLVVNFRNLTCSSMMASEKTRQNEEFFLKLFLTGLTNPEKLGADYDKFHNDFMSELIVKQQAILIQILRKVYGSTPNFLYTDYGCCDRAVEFFSVLLQSLHTKERRQVSARFVTNII
ncbi:HrpJ domain-containing protein [Erwinia tasmaniensis]|uniref:Type III secretion apparatus n=1 Tax=Erwinia tasmaniensis (strain DSM 17950 / CFBP 7177 / CIP 109463 / NCPPB 4357 / Et1/99) TaxID=465817 RepID=B2VEF2_ERWT9|nr:HrpJ domain-containing protein [Erwinia tasmaniensis]CAO96953.1 Type III secretion apparatus [Erwinia tasmaniensis Et1/99]